MEHAIIEKMHEMVGTGELSEGSFKKLADELGRTKEKAGAPLFEATYTENVIVAKSHMDDDSDLNTCLLHFKTDYVNAAKTKIVRGVKKNPAAYRGRAVLFHKYHEIDLDDDGALCKDYQPGYTMTMNMCRDEPSNGNACMIIYTILKVRKFNKKRKSHADPGDGLSPEE